LNRDAIRESNSIWPKLPALYSWEGKSSSGLESRFIPPSLFRGPLSRRPTSTKKSACPLKKRPGQAARKFHAKIVFVLGGANSGKSELALNLAGEKSPRVFVATCEPLDEEMRERIQAHQQSRRGLWETAEVPVDLAKWFQEKGAHYKSVVLDCLTLWLCNLQGRGIPPTAIPSLVDELLHSVCTVRSQVVIVSNEVGLGIVPGDATSRGFRALAGKVNQQVAQVADEVYLVISGLPVQLK